MKTKYLAAALLGTAMIAGAASAQTTTAANNNGQWRTSKIIGSNVYNNANDKIGDVEELLVDKSGKITNVVLGVGGFLGVGEHNVEVSFDKLKWVNQPVSDTSASNAPKTTTEKSTTGSTVTTTTTSTRPVRDANEKWYPDHAVFDATKDQLKAMPEFKY